MPNVLLEAHDFEGTPDPILLGRSSYPTLDEWSDALAAFHVPAFVALAIHPQAVFTPMPPAPRRTALALDDGQRVTLTPADEWRDMLGHSLGTVEEMAARVAAWTPPARPLHCNPRYASANHDRWGSKTARRCNCGRLDYPHDFRPEGSR